MRKLGINLGSYVGIPALDQIEYIKSAGFDSAFTDFNGYEKNAVYAEKLAKTGLAYETIHAPFKGINNMWFAGEDGDAMLAELNSCVDTAAALDVPTVIIHLSSWEKALRRCTAGWILLGLRSRILLYSRKTRLYVALWQPLDRSASAR